jgi:hypothetical protein
VELWLLLEYPRPWKSKALEDNDLPEAVNRHLATLPAEVAARSGLKLRVQFIKQAASADVAKPRVFLADGRPGQTRLLATELDNYAAIAYLPAAELASGNLPDSRLAEEPVYLVCTNGQRDLCCARFGLPLFEALRIEYGQRIWQTTHIGGHRYAPNLVCLPSGIVYGFVDPEQGPGLVAAHDRSELSLAHLRGRACFPPVAQSAEYFSRQQSGDRRLACPAATIAPAEGDVTEVTIGGQTLRVRQLTGQEPVIASCDAAPKPASSYLLAGAEA